MVVDPLTTGPSRSSAAPADPTSSNTSSTASSGGTNPLGSLTNESTFLQLLMAQVQNQDPMNPTDSTQFIGQLVSFSQLEQLLSINQGVQTLVTKSQPPTTTGSPTTPTTPTNPTNSAG